MSKCKAAFPLLKKTEVQEKAKAIEETAFGQGTSKAGGSLLLRTRADPVARSIIGLYA
jgi:hypothetical protein